MPSVQVRNVPEHVHAALVRRAECAGQSLQQYLTASVTVLGALPPSRRCSSGSHNAPRAACPDEMPPLRSKTHVIVVDVSVLASCGRRQRSRRRHVPQPTSRRGSRGPDLPRIEVVFVSAGKSRGAAHRRPGRSGDRESPGSPVRPSTRPHPAPSGLGAACRVRRPQEATRPRARRHRGVRRGEIRRPATNPGTSGRPTTNERRSRRSTGAEPTASHDGEAHVTFDDDSPVPLHTSPQPVTGNLAVR